MSLNNSGCFLTSQSLNRIQTDTFANNLLSKIIILVLFWNKWFCEIQSHQSKSCDLILSHTPERKHGFIPIKLSVPHFPHQRLHKCVKTHECDVVRHIKHKMCFGQFIRREFSLRGWDVSPRWCRNCPCFSAGVWQKRAVAADQVGKVLLQTAAWTNWTLDKNKVPPKRKARSAAE